MLALIGDISFCVLYIVWGVHHYVSPEEFMKVHAGFIGLAVIAALCMLFEVPRMMFSVKVRGTTFRVRNGLVPYTAEASQLKRIRCYTRSKRGNVYYCISLQFSGKRSVELRKGMSNFIRFATYAYSTSSQGNTTWSNSPFNERNPRYRGFLLLSDYIVSFSSSGYFFVISTNLSKFSIKASTTNGANCRPFWETISS